MPKVTQFLNSKLKVGFQGLRCLALVTEEESLLHSSLRPHRLKTSKQQPPPPQTSSSLLEAAAQVSEPELSRIRILPLVGFSCESLP